MLRRALQGDLTADALFTAPCAVAVAARGQSVHVPQRIGVAWDGSAESGEALEWAVQLAERVGGRLRILRIAEPGDAEGAPDVGLAEELEAVRAAAERRAPAEATLVWGDPASKLHEAEHDLDLLVMGSRGRSPQQRTMLGSVSADVLHHALCSVVVLPRGVVVPVDAAAV
jgi:nucleotide-binding universal stress UspA family protein